MYRKQIIKASIFGGKKENDEQDKREDKIIMIRFFALFRKILSLVTILIL